MLRRLHLLLGATCSCCSSLQTHVGSSSCCSSVLDLGGSSLLDCGGIVLIMLLSPGVSRHGVRSSFGSLVMSFVIVPCCCCGVPSCCGCGVLSCWCLSPVSVFGVFNSVLTVGGVLSCCGSVSVFGVVLLRFGEEQGFGVCFTCLMRLLSTALVLLLLLLGLSTTSTPLTISTQAVSRLCPGVLSSSLCVLSMCASRLSLRCVRQRGLEGVLL